MAMDCSSAQPHQQEVGLEGSRSQAEKKPRPAEQSLKCPRCDSTNTKFCYYNNYSLSQPRYFCKSCRRYWTKGGTLRNVPVGGGCRKTKRSRRNHDHPTPTNTIPSYTYDSNMAIQGFQRPTGLDDIAGDYGLIDALRGGFLQLHNLYDGGMEMGMGMGIGGLGQQMGFEEFDTAVKQEIHGFPRQINGGGDDGISMMGELDSHARIGNWNSWHGLLNSPLM